MGRRQGRRGDLAAFARDEFCQYVKLVVKHLTKSAGCAIVITVKKGTQKEDTMVKPFTYIRSHGNNPCVICGKEIKSKAEYLPIVWNEFVSVDTDPSTPGYMGGFPIGMGCWRKYTELHTLK